MWRENVLNLLKMSLWGNDIEINGSILNKTYEEMKRHAIIAIPAAILSDLPLSTELYETWKKSILYQLAYYGKYTYIQEMLPVSVPYVILKGTSAAQYYPHPEYRSLGDIDIMTRHEDYKSACIMLLEDGYCETTDRCDHDRGRHRTFEKNNIIVEVHAFFASMNDPVKARIFDDLIIEHINNDHILPDMINGLVLIEHINQHMEEGIGLRQVIDWMMFVDKCLPDQRWEEFQLFASATGLEKLAVSLTRMCEIYLGLSEHRWCAGVDKQLCSDMMDYYMSSGNLGQSLDQKEQTAVVRGTKIRHPVSLIKELQDRGIRNWTGAKNPVLRPFAWIWQGIQFVRSTPGIVGGYKNANKLDNLFEALDVKRIEKGLVYYKDGKYYKK